MKQKFLQSLGTLRRRSSENVRYTPIANRYFTLSTHERHADSVSAAELHGIKTFFGTEQTRGTLLDEQVEFFDEVSDIGAGGFNYFAVPNPYNFKTPLNAAIADSTARTAFHLQLGAAAKFALLRRLDQINGGRLLRDSLLVEEG